MSIARSTFPSLLFVAALPLALVTRAAVADPIAIAEVKHDGPVDFTVRSVSEIQIERRFGIPGAGQSVPFTGVAMGVDDHNVGFEQYTGSKAFEHFFQNRVPAGSAVFKRPPFPPGKAVGGYLLRFLRRIFQSDFMENLLQYGRFARLTAFA